MDHREIINAPCFICETKYSAGIFLSKPIAMRKPYADSFVSIIEYPNYMEAENVFFTKYRNVIADRGEFYINELMKVRETAIYTVFYNENFVGITCTNNLARVLPPEITVVFADDNLEYEEAQELAKRRIAEMTGKCNMILRERIKINQVIYL